MKAKKISTGDIVILVINNISAITFIFAGIYAMLAEPKKLTPAGYIIVALICFGFPLWIFWTTYREIKKTKNKVTTKST